jgi:Fe-S-cluster containining protein
MRVALRVLGEAVELEALQPPGPVRLDEVLPFLRELEDRVIDVTVKHAERGGTAISCRAGCAACCKAQPVPVTPPEAYAPWRLVESLPEPQRQTVRARFADRVNRLRQAGLDQHFLHRAADLTQEEARAIAERYFRLRLACPFLEDDCCSIYKDRPFVCRQYLVTSPAELCEDPFHNPVRPVPMPIAAAGATLETAEELLKTPQLTVPLILALDYAAAHREELENRFDAQALYEGWLKAITA